MKNKLYYIIIAAYLYPCDMFAAPADYGRQLHSSKFSVFAGQTILSIIVCILLYILIKRIFGGCKSKSPTQMRQSKQPHHGLQKQVKCPCCNGEHFIDLGPLSSSRIELSDIDPGEIEFYWGTGNDTPIQCARRVCPHCKGKGFIYPKYTRQ